MHIYFTKHPNRNSVLDVNDVQAPNHCMGSGTSPEQRSLSANTVFQFSSHIRRLKLYHAIKKLYVSVRLVSAIENGLWQSGN